MSTGFVCRRSLASALSGTTMLTEAAPKKHPAGSALRRTGLLVYWRHRFADLS
jgi:hypothetical protein